MNWHICDTVARALALVQHIMAPKEKTSVIDQFFELYGFDLLLDTQFNMWLLEINTFPSLVFDEDVDFEVKGLRRCLSQASQMFQAVACA